MGRDRNEEANGRLDPAMLKEYRRTEVLLAVWTEFLSEEGLGEIMITQVTIQGPNKGRDGFLAIIKGENERRETFVAFRTAGTVKDLMAKVYDDERNDSLKFKEEVPWDANGEKAKAKAAQKKGGG